MCVQLHKNILYWLQALREKVTRNPCTYTVFFRKSHNVLFMNEGVHKKNKPGEIKHPMKKKLIKESSAYTLRHSALRSLGGEQLTVRSSLEIPTLLFKAETIIQKRKIPHILALNFGNFSIFLYRHFLVQEIKRV